MHMSEEHRSLHARVAELEEENALLRARLHDIGRPDSLAPAWCDLFDTLPLMVWHCDAMGLWDYCNKARLEFTGRDLARELGKGWIGGVHPEDRKHRDSIFNAAFNGREPFSMEYRLRGADGQYRWIMDQGHPVLDAQGLFQGYLGGCFDISKSRDIEASLRITEQHLRTLVDNLPLGVSLVSVDHVVLMVNQAMATMFGRPLESLPGHKCHHVFTDCDHVCEQCPGVTAMLERRPAEARMPGRRMDNSRFNADIQALPVFDAERVAGFIEIVQDRSEQERIEGEKLLLAELLDNAEHVAVFKDPDLRYVSVNRAYLKLTGLSSVGDVLGKTDAELFAGLSSPEQIQGYMDNDRAALRLPRGGTITSEERTFAGSGEERTFLTKKFPVYSPEDKLLGVATLTTEITDRKRIEDRLTRANQQLHVLFENIPGHINVVDTNFNIVGTSRGLLDTFGIENRESILGEKCYTALHGLKAVCPWCALPESFRKKSALVRYSTPEEEERTGKALKIYTAPILNPEGGIMGGMEFVADITDLRQLERDLVKALDASKAAGKAKSEFLATMSHEIRTPLNGVIGMLQLLEDSDLPPEQLEYVQTALHSSSSLLAVINDILDISKIEAGRLELVESSFSLAEVLRQVLGTFRQQVKEKNLSLSFVVDPRIPSVVRGDMGRLRQILFNLVGNSVKFTDTGGVSIVVSPLPQGSPQGTLRLLFSVNDTGSGIDEMDLEHLFEPFTQKDGSYSRRHQGTGLGLTVVKKLTELMHGSVSIESEPGAGTSVFFTVLLGREERPCESGCPKAQTLATTVSPRLKVLLAEDNKVNQLVTTRLLQRWGHEVVVVGSGEEVLDALREQHFDLVLMDIQMPLMDGIETTRRIRNDTSGTLPAGIPIVAMTAHAMHGDEDIFLRSGMNDYLPKPLNLDELQRVLATVIR